MNNIIVNFRMMYRRPDDWPRYAAGVLRQLRRWLLGDFDD